MFAANHFLQQGEHAGVLQLFLGNFNRLFLGGVRRRVGQQHASSAFGGVIGLVVVSIAAPAFIQTFSLIVVVSGRRRSSSVLSLLFFLLENFLVVGVGAKLILLAEPAALARIVLSAFAFHSPLFLLFFFRRQLSRRHRLLCLRLRLRSRSRRRRRRRRLLVLLLFFGQALRQLLLEPRVLLLFHRSRAFRLQRLQAQLLSIVVVVVFARVVVFLGEFLRLFHRLLHVVELAQKLVRVLGRIDFQILLLFVRVLLSPLTLFSIELGQKRVRFGVFARRRRRRLFSLAHFTFFFDRGGGLVVTRLVFSQRGFPARVHDQRLHHFDLILHA